MSRDWTERKYINVDSLWAFVDEQARQIELQLEDEHVKGTEAYKMLLLGRREMLNRLMDSISENESYLAEIAKLWGLEEEKSE